MITVKLYQFSKRRNSTALPTSGTSSVDVSVLLKDKCSSEFPVLELESNDPSGYINYNYAYIAYFNRYYFVTKREYDTGSRIYIHLEEDYLGSFKSQILLQGGFIKYSSNGSTDIIDSRLATTKNMSIGSALAAFPYTSADSYFISVVGKNGVNTFFGERTDIMILFRDIDYQPAPIVAQSGDIPETIANLANGIVECFQQNYTQGFVEQNLRAAFITPIVPPASVLDLPKTVYLGQFNSGIALQPVKAQISFETATITIPWTVNDWRRLSPYTTVILQLPGVGCVQLDNNDILNSTYLTIKMYCNFTTGDFLYSVSPSTDSNREIFRTTFNIASDWGVGSSNNAMTKFVGAYSDIGKNPYLANTLSGQMAEDFLNAVGGIIGAGLQGAANITGGLPTTNSGSNAIGSAISFKGLGGIRCFTYTKNLIQNQSDFALTHGYPLFMNDSFASHTGFLQTEGFRSQCNGTKNENDNISEYLNSGIYIE